jgi:hypothetical protein
MREAWLQPKVVGEFLRRYNGSKLPTKKIGRNVLETLGVPPDATERTFDLIVSGARSLGLLRESRSTSTFNLTQTSPPQRRRTWAMRQVTMRAAYPSEEATQAPTLEASGIVPADTATADLKTNRRVFITHGKNKKIADQLKELLTFGNFEPIVSVELESVSKPVPDKVLDDMRSCGAAVIHVGTDQRLLDNEGNEHRVINPNVLIEIGAAMMRYGRNFILLVEQGTTCLPTSRGYMR